MGGFGFPPAEHGEYRAPEPARAIFELRPLSTGEILDRTFTLYRQRFWLYVGLSCVSSAVATLVTFLQITFGLSGKAPAANPDPLAAAMVGFKLLGGLFFASLVSVLVYSFTRAAAVSAVEANYLGRETSIGAAFRAVRSKWYRFALIALWQSWSLMWPMLALLIPGAFLAGFLGKVGGGGRAAVGIVFVVLLLLLIPGFIVGFIFYLRNSLGIVASVSEGLGVRASMRRSKFLVADYKARVFVLYLLLAVLGFAVGMVQYFFNIFLITSHGPVRVGVEILTLLVTFVSSSLVQPVGAIAFVLFYIDQRVRKEGFDVEMLLARVTGIPVAAREMESPFAGELGGSVFASGALPGSFPPPPPASFPPPPTGDSPFSSGPLPGASTESHE